MADAYNARIIEEFRATNGNVGGEWEGYPLILVHHVGARSGIERVTPLGCFPLTDGRWAVVGSNGGSQADPAWCHNLRAYPRITVEVGAETVEVDAEELDDTARQELWPELVEQAPQLAGHARVARPIPVFVLTRR